MKPKYLLGVLILIVAIGGAAACSVLLPSGNTQTNQQSSDPVATTAPAVEQSANTQTNQQSEPTVKAQTITCSKCGGSGTISCSKCGGSGHVATGGSCSACGGDGKQYVDANGVVHPNVIQLVAVLACHEQTCTVCGGTGGGSQSGVCNGCGGDGAITCPKCGGAGHIHT
jgi:hypothetical protein